MPCPARLSLPSSWVPGWPCWPWAVPLSPRPGAQGMLRTGVPCAPCRELSEAVGGLPGAFPARVSVAVRRGPVVGGDT